MPPLDGQACCNGNYRREVMRRADRTIAARNAEIVTLRALLAECRRKHNSCEDSWYSCPKSPEGCSNDSVGPECDCGADRINAMIDHALTPKAN